jgi:hypothetical protein
VKGPIIGTGDAVRGAYSDMLSHGTVSAVLVLFDPPPEEVDVTSGKDRGSSGRTGCARFITRLAPSLIRVTG